MWLRASWDEKKREKHRKREAGTQEGRQAGARQTGRQAGARQADIDRPTGQPGRVRQAGGSGRVGMREIQRERQAGAKVHTNVAQGELG